MDKKVFIIHQLPIITHQLSPDRSDYPGTWVGESEGRVWRAWREEYERI